MNSDLKLAGVALGIGCAVFVAQLAVYAALIVGFVYLVKWAWTS